MRNSSQRHFTRREIPQDDPSRKVEVLVSEGETGRREVLLRDLSFGQGIGWFVQKTIRLDPEQVNALLRALCCTRQPRPGQPCSGHEHWESNADRAAGTSAQIIQLVRGDMSGE
jgi:hypothetical protein